MPTYNQTKEIEFFLLGFQTVCYVQNIAFVVLFIFYCLTVAGNALIITLYLTSCQLRSPMYFFLFHLSLCDLIVSSNVSPNALKILIQGGSTMSFSGCVTQFYFFAISSIAECCLLTVMSFDRYLAICNPMHYTSIMCYRLLVRSATACWIAGLVIPVFTCCLLPLLDFCGPNMIDHFFCDLVPLLKLSCSDTTFVQIETSVVASVVGVFQLSFIVVTYVCILNAIIRITSSMGRRKAFSTCSNHLCVVCIYYLTLNSLYVSPSKGFPFNLNKFLSLMNTVVTPLLNPIIYSLRNNEIKTAIKKTFCI